MSFSIGQYGDNSYLVYQFEENDEIETMSFGQITNNQIDGLAPATFTQMDVTKSIMYKITSHISLEDFLQRPIKKKDLLRILSGILKAVSAAQEYMIEEAMFLLDRKYIYLKTSSFEVKMICLPVQRTDYRYGDLQAFLWDIVAKTAKDKTESREYVSELMEKLSPEISLSMEEMEKILESFQQGNEHSASKPQAEVLPKAEPKPEPKAEVKVEPKIDPKPVSEPKAYEWEKDLKQGFGDEVREQEKKSGSGFLGFLRGSKEKPEKVKKESAPKKLVKQAPAVSGNQVNLPFAVPGVEIPAMEPEESPKQAHKPATPKKKEPVQQEVINRSSSSNYNGTIYVSSGENNSGTIWDTLVPMEPAGGYVHLVRESNNEMIAVEGTNFRIGSDISYADYHVSNNKTVSGTHAVILAHQNAYFIKDTNSKYHTYVDDEKITNDREVPLNHGAKIRLGSERFTFYLY